MGWLDSFFRRGYAQIQLNGSVLPAENILNLVTGFTAADDSANARTNVSATSLSIPTYAKLTSFQAVANDPTYTAIVDAPITITVGASGKVWLQAHASGLGDNSGSGSLATARMRVSVDDNSAPYGFTDYLGTFSCGYASQGGIEMALNCVAEGLSPGAHTFLLVGSYSGPQAWSIDGSGDRPRQTAWLFGIPL